MFFVGIDMVEIKRISKCMKNPKFLNKILGLDEYESLKKRKFSEQSVAASFCAKEAFAKNIGTGIRNFNLREVQLLRKKNGAPYLKLSGSAFKLASRRKFSVSVTHTKEYASVVVISWKQD